MFGSVLRYVWRHRRSGRRPVSLLLLVAAVLAGVLGMHGLAAVPPDSGTHMASAAEPTAEYRTGDQPTSGGQLGPPPAAAHQTGPSPGPGTPGDDSEAHTTVNDGSERHGHHHNPPGDDGGVNGSDGCHHGMPAHADPECVSAAPPGGASVPAPDAAPLAPVPDSPGHHRVPAPRQAAAQAPTLSELQILRM